MTIHFAVVFFSSYVSFFFSTLLWFSFVISGVYVNGYYCYTPISGFHITSNGFLIGWILLYIIDTRSAYVSEQKNCVRRWCDVFRTASIDSQYDFSVMILSFNRLSDRLFSLDIQA